MSRELELQRQQFPKSVYQDERIIVAPYQKWLVGNVRVPLLALMGAVGLVLLIACLNVANLLLARGIARQREVALRLALGASRSRVIRQLLTEAVPLALLGAGLGLVIANWGTMYLRGNAPEDIPLLSQVLMDSRVFCFSLALAVLTAIVSGLIPALHVARPKLHETLKEGSRVQTDGRMRQRTRSILVVAEIGLSTLLMSGAALLIVSLSNLMSVNPGFDVRNLWVMRVNLPTEKYQTSAQVSGLEQQVQEQLRTLPGVKAVASASAAPVADQFNLMADVHGESIGATQYRAVSPEYFKALGIRLLRGRALLSTDTAGSPGVAVINAAFAKRFWSDRSPIGDVLTIMKGIPKFGEPPRQVVGVAADTMVWLGVPVPSVPMIYVPESQVPSGLTGQWLRSPVWVIRTSIPLNLREVELKVREVDPTQPVWSLQPATALIHDSAKYQQFMTMLLSGFAVLALLLALIGLYGVISYSMVQRTHEIGIRMALGATRSQVLKIVIGQGARLAAIGVVIGLAGAFAVARFLSNLLYGVQPNDPLTYIAVSMVLALVAMLASYLPARRAMRVDPMVALRYE